MPTQSAIHSIGPSRTGNLRLPQGGTYFLLGKISMIEDSGASQSAYMCVKPGGSLYNNIDDKFRGWGSFDTFAWKIS